MSSIGERFAESILKCGQNYMAAVSRSNMIFDYLEGNDTEIVLFFTRLLEKNIVCALVIYVNYTNSFNVKLGTIRQILKNELDDRIAEYDGDVIDLRIYKKENPDEYKLNREIVFNIALNMVLSLVVSGEEILSQDLFEKLIARVIGVVKTHELYMYYCNRIIFLFGEQERGFYFLKLYESYDISSKYKGMALSTAISWSDTPLVISKKHSSYINSFISNVYKRGDMYSLLQFVKVFPQTTFATLNCTIDDFVKMLENYSLQEAYTDFFKGLRCAEMLLKREAGMNRRLAIDALINPKNQAIASNHMLFDCLKVYNICDRIIHEPENAEQYISSKIIADNSLYIHLADVQRNAFYSLVRVSPESVLMYLKRLNVANCYILNRERRWEFYDDKNKSLLQLNRLTEYYDDEDLAYIYLNSPLKKSVPIEELFRIIYERAEKKHDNYMMISNTFKRFTIVGNLKCENGTLKVYTKEFVAFHSFSIARYEQIASRYNTNSNLNNCDKQIKFNLNSFNVINGFAPQIEIIDDTDSDAIKDRKQIIIDVCKVLDSIRIKGNYSEEDLNILSELPEQLKIKQDYEEIGMHIIRACMSLISNSDRVMLIKNIKNNPYRQDNNHRFSMIGIRMQKELFDECVSFSNTILKEKNHDELKIFLYFNTILRRGYSFDVFVKRIGYFDETMQLSELMKYNNCTLIGKISADYNDHYIITPTSFYIKPAYIEEPAKIICYKSDIDNNQKIFINRYVSFALNCYRRYENIFVAMEIERIEPSNNKAFVKAMNKAQFSIELDRFDVKNFTYMPQGLDYPEMLNLARSETLSIKRRIHDKKLLFDFFEMIVRANPWSNKKRPLPCIISRDDAASFHAYSTLNDMLGDYSIREINKLYFNTSLRSAVTLDEYAGILIDKHIDKNSVMDAVSYFRLEVFSDLDSGSFRTNLLVDKHHMDLKIGIYKVVDYDIANKLLVFEKVEAK